VRQTEPAALTPCGYAVHVHVRAGDGARLEATDTFLVENLSSSLEGVLVFTLCRSEVSPSAGAAVTAVAHTAAADSAAVAGIAGAAATAVSDAAAGAIGAADAAADSSSGAAVQSGPCAMDTQL
jgi:hypothetical protein